MYFFYFKSIDILFDLREPFLTACNFCYEHARDLISFTVDRTLKSINTNVGNIENRSRITAARLPNVIK